jgi:hypothetical protein
MSREKKSAKRKTRSKAMPVLGVAGVTFSLLTGVSAALAHPSLDQSSDSRSHEVVLSEGEIFDVSLATFYAIDQEGQDRAPRTRLAMAACGGCGMGCAGCGGCGGCWGGNYYGYGPPPIVNEAYPPPEPIRPVPKYRHTHKRTYHREDR